MSLDPSACLDHWHINDSVPLGSVFRHVEMHMESSHECLPTTACTPLLELHQKNRVTMQLGLPEMEGISLLQAAL